MKKYLSICAAREGITYAFDKGQIINVQDDLKYLGDVPMLFIFKQQQLVAFLFLTRKSL